MQTTDVESAAPSFSPVPAMLAGMLVPAAVVAAVWFLAPMFATQEGGVESVRLGGAIGALAGGIVALLIGAWTYVSCKKQNSAFLAPLAFGFLTKAFALCLGTWLVWRFMQHGAHMAYAVAFVAAAFGFGLVYTPLLARGMSTRPQAGPAAG